MWREIAVTLYLYSFSFIFRVCKSFPQRTKTIFVVYFGYNVKHLLDEWPQGISEHSVVVTGKHTKASFENKRGRTIIPLKGFRIDRWIRFIYHLATSKTVVVDNYYAFLQVTPFKKNVRCIQLWHAAGAVKQFGLEDHSLGNRSERAIKRFRDVYNRMDYVAVGSEHMGDIFSKSFGIPPSRMLHIGVPRTDFFHQEEKHGEIIEEVNQKYPELKGKKVILYAPTFRDHEQHKKTPYPLDLERMKDVLGDEYVLLLKCHPIVTYHIDHKLSDFVISANAYRDINHLLLVTDVLITDYSSIPFEFSFLKRPMIFYPYDLESYEKERGIQEDYEALVPGPVAHSTEDIIKMVQTKTYNEEEMEKFHKKWNRFSDGRSSKRLVNFIFSEQHEE
ncbi:CDP-glycerol glycerophosphotransferase family protein (plasmid) [Pontibacillus sp. ALD_SL1]|uniref:CDP-glycerol glycerophosphotransferase family protein n=1 Tax=Pontibacillus sp. ALD_SL1 TaxID=2777185 RepID=UPI001A97BBE7|nr:CDP-glycerol glycerophosphotransferase family protein [Pontibacillus sp. ALD_SL1]QST02826.1 CDP-glycerol glycerophosphotransferase family protein [Pontibacillus sp. ALD_SL1]